MDALTRAQNDANRMLDRARKSASSGFVDAMAPSAVSRAGSKLSQHREQYRHFRDWPYVAIRAIANRLAAQPIYVGNLKPAAASRSRASLNWRSKAFLDDLQPLDSHLILSLIEDPNAVMVRWSLIFSVVASLELTGQSLLWLMDGANRGMRYDLWPIPSHWATPKDVLRQSWEIRPDDSAAVITVPGNEIIYFNLPNPGDPFGSTSPLQTQSRAVDTDNQLQLAQSTSLENGMYPQLAVSVGKLPNGQFVRLEKEQRLQLYNTLKSRWRGAKNFGEPFLLDGLLTDIKPIDRSPQELPFESSGTQTKSRILQAYGVNPLILGEIQGANRAQAVVAEESLCSNVLNPLAELISQVLTKWLVPALGDEGLIVWMEPCRANDPETTLKEWELAADRGFVSPNEYRARVLGLGPTKGGDTRLVPMNYVPPIPTD